MFSMARFALVRKLLVRSKSMDEILGVCLGRACLQGRERIEFAVKVMRMRLLEHTMYARS